MKFSKKHILLPLLLILFCILYRTFLFNVESDTAFTELHDEMAVHMLTDNPFELHYSIAYPEMIGLGELSHDLVPFQKDFYLQSRAYWKTCSEKLSDIDTKELTEEEGFLYELLCRHTRLQLESLSFAYYENPLTCSGGVQSQLPILLSEYTFRSKTDVENYLLLLSQVPDYLAGLETYVTLQETNGIYICQENWEAVRMQCLSLFPADQLENGSHFLQTSFDTRIKELVSQALLTKQEALAYTSRNNALLLNKLVPAYQALADVIGALHGTDKLEGLCSYPDGQKYYAMLLADHTGSSKSVEEIKAMLYERYQQLYDAFLTLLQNNSVVQNWTFPISKPSEMLQHLYRQSQTQFPSLSDVTDGSVQQVDLKKVDGILAESSAPAFYMTPPIDANDAHTIYINPSAKMKPFDLYTTLAHEGFPGHLYQTVYSQSFLQKNNAPLIRQLLYYGGFTEGWAVYAELYSYDFAAGLCDKKLADTILLERYNREIQLCLCSILDIFIHYEGADLEAVQNLLQKLGLQTGSAQAIYEVICDSPANYPKYYVGYLEILNLREAAKTFWGDAYSDYAFHKWFLESGGGDFESLTHRLSSDL